MTEMMRAVFLDGHNGLESVIDGERPKPESGPGEVLIKLVAAGINRVDLYMTM